MAEVKLYTLAGKEKGSITLADAVFGVEFNSGLVHEAVVAQNANAREAIAHTKMRGEVSGGGKKPWKQKGTGRARHGSTRSPIWVGGGITHGPRNDRNFSVKLNRSMKRQALAAMLSERVREGAFIAVEDFVLEAAKTATVSAMRKALPQSAAKALVVTTAADKDMIRAARNLKNTQTIAAQSLNVRDLATFPVVIASQAAIEEIVNTYGA